MSADFLTKVAESTQSAVQKLHVRSALNPMLWLCGIATPLCLSGAYLFKEFDLIRNLFAIMGIVPIIITCIGFGYFAIVKPEKLQSEDYQLRHESLQMIQQKGGRIILDPASIEAIANPVSRQLPPERRDHE
jgi:hypothetical protein